MVVVDDTTSPEKSALPDKFDVHEWAIMDRFSESQKVARLRNDLHAAIRGAGAFRLFKHLLTEKQPVGRLESVQRDRTSTDRNAMVRRARYRVSPNAALSALRVKRLGGLTRRL
jgi:hypothetical protein